MEFGRFHLRAAVLVLWASGLALSRPGPVPLRNAYYRLTVDKRLTVGYFGGSITAGSGASEPDSTAWRPLTDAWLRKAFPAAALTPINAAIGGTGADLGAFRLRHDLLGKDPDLVFVEFAVNDGGKPRATVIACTEGIVRQIRSADPFTDIVFVYTTSASLAKPYDGGRIPPTIQYQQEVADRYGIPAINVGRALWDEVHAGRETWESLLTDGTHPNDKGHRIYAQRVRDSLAARLSGPVPAARLPWGLPAALSPDPVDAGDLIDGWALDAPGWQKQDSSLAGRYPHRIAADAPGTRLRFPFRGRAVGVYWLVGPESGDVEWSIDGSAPARASSWDGYAKSYARAFYRVFALDLPAGDHVLTLTVLADKNAGSKGTWIRIGALMVNGVALPTPVRDPARPSVRAERDIPGAAARAPRVDPLGRTVAAGRRAEAAAPAWSAPARP